MEAFVQQQGLTFPTLLDESGDVSKGYRVLGIPTSFFVSREGMIQAQHTGPLNESLIHDFCTS